METSTVLIVGVTRLIGHEIDRQLRAKFIPLNEGVKNTTDPGKIDQLTIIDCPIFSCIHLPKPNRMKTIYLITMIELFLFICANVIQAQESIATSGGNATGSGGTVSYTIGQVAYTTNRGATGLMSQGVQQPYEILVVTGLNEAKGISLEVSVYPNPTSDFLKLKVESYKLENLSYQLYDINGNLLQNREIVGKETVIQTGGLLSASYFLRISDKQKEVKTFKIIKN